MRHRFVAGQADRLDKLIAAHTPLSRKRARALVERGGVHVDGGKARLASQPVEAGAVVEVRSAADREKAPALPERYRDADVVVVDKPSGLPTQAGREGGQVHVVGLLSGSERYVGLHHRLDTPASGLLLLTLRKAANAAIAAAFAEGAVEREYLAVVLGDPGPAGRWADELDGQPAATRWRRLSTAGGTSLLWCTLETGRTHQVRLHAAMAGHPILGDRRHGGAAGRAWPRLALHAARLTFPQPTTGQRVRVTSPVPADLAALVEAAGTSPEGLYPAPG
jgi:23S rRNA pseudouridine1911/1915/1917 synthase